LGAEKESTRYGVLYTRRFEKGFQIKKRGGEWLTLNEDEADQLAMKIRPMATFCPLSTEVSVTAMLQLAGKTKAEARKLIKAYKDMSTTDHLKLYDSTESCEAMQLIARNFDTFTGTGKRMSFRARCRKRGPQSTRATPATRTAPKWVVKAARQFIAARDMASLRSSTTAIFASGDHRSKATGENQ
jgi:hypothetical protein